MLDESTIDCVRSENQRSRPTFSVRLAKMATSTAGVMATMEKSTTMRTCRRAAALPFFRAFSSRLISRPMRKIRPITKIELMTTEAMTTFDVGAIGVTPRSTNRVRMAQTRATPASTSPGKAKDILRSATTMPAASSATVFSAADFRMHYSQSLASQHHISEVRRDAPQTGESLSFLVFFKQHNVAKVQRQMRPCQHSQLGRELR